MAFVRLTGLADCPCGSGRFLKHGTRNLAVFRTADDRVFVIDNECPHAGGDLSRGELADDHVTCPWHQWTFDLRTGVSKHSPAARVRRYPVEVRDGTVYVDFDLPVPPVFPELHE